MSAGTVYAAATAYAGVPALTPQDVATIRFTTVRRGGLDPREVYGFLAEVAAAMHAQSVAAAADREKARRATEALHNWQSRNAGFPAVHAP